MCFIIITDMEISFCAKSDFDQIITDIVDFWGSDRTLSIHHPMFIYEFGNTAFVVRDGERVAAYLFGFFSQTEPAGYIHLIGVRKSYQGKGLGKLLYNNFEAIAKRHGCSKLKAVTTPGNRASVLFHKKIGMKLLGEKIVEGIEVVKDYSALGQDRVVFEKDI